MRPLFTRIFLFLLSGFFLLPAQLHSAQSTGEEVYVKWCDGCHMDSPFAPGTIQLRQLRGDDMALISKRTDLTAPFIRHIVRKGINGMPLFRRTEISNEELDSLVKYLLDR